jgi:plasmid stabilization system protein ParE
VAEIVWSLQAVTDVESIKTYISRDSRHYAALVVARLVAAVERVGEFPESGRIVPEINDASIREVLWRNYRIVYRLSGSSVQVVTVFHGAMLFRPGGEGGAG